MTDSTDLAQPRKHVDRLPVISGEAYQHVGRFAGALVMSCFEQMGGLPRMVAWAEGNPTDFYTKLFPKMIQRSTSVDVSGTITLDDAIARLESNVIEAEFDVITGTVEEAPQYDL
jgi:hypothetical protein